MAFGGLFKAPNVNAAKLQSNLKTLLNRLNEANRVAKNGGNTSALKNTIKNSFNNVNNSILRVASARRKYNLAVSKVAAKKNYQAVANAARQQANLARQQENAARQAQTAANEVRQATQQANQQNVIPVSGKVARISKRKFKIGNNYVNNKNIYANGRGVYWAIGNGQNGRNTSKYYPANLIKGSLNYRYSNNKTPYNYNVNTKNMVKANGN
jgi:hypothetical protein